MALFEADLERAGRLHEEALELLREQGEKWGMGITLVDLALLRLLQQRHSEARAVAAEAIALADQFDDRRALGWSIGILSGIEAAEGYALRAAQFYGAMEGLLQSVGAPVQPTFKTWVTDRYFEGARRSIGDEVFEQARAEGRAMSAARAMELGLDAASHSR